MPRRTASAGVRTSTGLPPRRTIARVSCVGADDGPRQLGPASPEQPRHADDLPAVHGQVDVVQQASAREAPRPRAAARHGARAVWESAPRVRDRPSAGSARQWRVTDVRGLDAAPVAHHGHAVADAGHFVEPMRDVDDGRCRARVRRPMIAKSWAISVSVSADVGSSMISMRGVGVQRLGDLDHLLLGDAEVADRNDGDRCAPPAQRAPRRPARASGASPRGRASGTARARGRCSPPPRARGRA